MIFHKIIWTPFFHEGMLENKLLAFLHYHLRLLLQNQLLKKYLKNTTGSFVHFSEILAVIITGIAPLFFCEDEKGGQFDFLVH